MGGIGGYMEFETYDGTEKYPELVPLNVARNSIRYLCKTKGYKMFYVPYFLGWSIFDLLNDDGIPYECYSLKDDLTPNFHRTLKSEECLFIVNFFGQISNLKLMSMKECYGNILIDNTQAFFQPPIKGIDTFYTCHKYFGVPDGAYLNTEIRLESLEADTSYERFKYLIGRYELGANAFYKTCLQEDDNLRYLNLKEMSKLTHNILRSLDYDIIEKIRKENFEYLDSRLGKYNEWKDLTTGTFMYPLLIKDDDRLRNALISNHVYVPRFWKNVIGIVTENSFENFLIHNLLPLPMDHRYGINDMRRIVALIEQCLN